MTSAPVLWVGCLCSHLPPSGPAQAGPPPPHAAPEAFLHSCSPPRRFQPSGPGWHRGARQPAHSCLHRASSHCGYASGSGGGGANRVGGLGSAHQLQDPTTSRPLFTGSSNLYHPPNLEKEVFPGPPAGRPPPNPDGTLGVGRRRQGHLASTLASEAPGARFMPVSPKGSQTKVCVPHLDKACWLLAPTGPSSPGSCPQAPGFRAPTSPPPLQAGCSPALSGPPSWARRFPDGALRLLL